MIPTAVGRGQDGGRSAMSRRQINATPWRFLGCGTVGQALSRIRRGQRLWVFAVARRRASRSPDLLGKPVLYQLSYVRARLDLSRLLRFALPCSAGPDPAAGLAVSVRAP